LTEAVSNAWERLDRSVPQTMEEAEFYLKEAEIAYQRAKAELDLRRAELRDMEEAE
jgi:hypothetical protein